MSALTPYSESVPNNDQGYVFRVIEAGKNLKELCTNSESPMILKVSGITGAGASAATANLGPLIMFEMSKHSAGAAAASWGLPAALGEWTAVGSMAAIGVPSVPGIVTLGIGIIVGGTTMFLGNYIYHLYKDGQAAEAKKIIEDLYTSSVAADKKIEEVEQKLRSLAEENGIFFETINEAQMKLMEMKEECDLPATPEQEKVILKEQIQYNETYFIPFLREQQQKMAATIGEATLRLQEELSEAQSKRDLYLKALKEAESALGAAKEQD